MSDMTTHSNSFKSLQPTPTLHGSTFDYLQPTPMQIEEMGRLRKATREYAAWLGMLLPDGPDKTYILRKVREIGMWANVCVTRHADGSPRDEGNSK